jgi:hypothetical protein
MQTIEDMERQAYADNNKPLADAYGRIIDLENQCAELRALVREALDFVASAEHADRLQDRLLEIEGR